MISFNCPFKCQAIVLLLAMLLSLPGNGQAALQAQSIHCSDTGETVRVIVELNENITLKETSGETDRITLELGPGSIGEAIRDIIFADNFLRQVKLFTVNKQDLLLDIMLREEAPYTISVWENPWRLVIDIIKDYKVSHEETIAPGLTYTNVRQRIGGRSLSLHFLTLDKTRWTVRPIMAYRETLNRDGLKNMASKSKASAAVNASYFGQDGWVIGNLKINGEIVASEVRPRTALLIHRDLKMGFALTRYEGTISLPDGNSLPVLGVNRERLANDLVVYQSDFSKKSKSKLPGCELLLTLAGQVLSVVFGGNVPFDPGQMVISAQGAPADKLAQLRPGDWVAIDQSIGEEADRALHVLGAGPRLLDTGLIVVAGNPEGFPPDIMSGRSPRTAVGLKENGDIVLFVADGRSKESSGLTLWETGEILQAFGVVDAINLDGGGSSEMVIGDRVLNAPSDKRERKISVALGVFPY